MQLCVTSRWGTQVHRGRRDLGPTTLARSRAPAIRTSGEGSDLGGAPLPPTSPEPHLITHRGPSRVGVAFVLLALVSTGLAQAPDEAAAAWGFVLLRVGCAGAVLSGLRRYRPQNPGVWIAWTVYFVLTALRGIRQLVLVVAGRHFELRESTSAFEVILTTASGAALVVGGVLLLRARLHDRATWALDDAVVMSSGLFVTFLTLTTLPMAVDDLTVQFVYVGIVLVIRDVAVAATGLALLYSERVRSPGVAGFAVLVPATLVGNLLFVAFGEPGPPTTASRMLVVGVLLGQVAVATVAVFPSMTELTEASRSRRASWTVGRTIALATCTAAPFVAVSISPPTSSTQWTIFAVAGSVMAALVVWRMRRSVVMLQGIAAEQRFAAEHDALSGLPNRRHMFGSFVPEVAPRRHGPPVELLAVYLDLDRLREVNDRGGHAAGDRLIVAVGHGLRALVGEEHPVGADAFRIGGDEFVVLVTLSADDAGDEVGPGLCTRIAEMLAEVQRGGLDGSGSIGWAVGELDDGPAVDEQVDRLINQADLAQVAAKRLGGGRSIAFSKALRDEANRRSHLRRSLPGSFERNEIRLAYQPVVELSSGSVFGAESLLRWTTATGERIPPPEVIDTATELGVLDDFGFDLVRLALSDISTVAASTTGRIGVNLAAAQLRPRTLDRLLDLLASSHLADRIWLEVTEQTVVEEQRYVSGALGDIRESGLMVAIDDFGTGYCGLEYLCTLPVDLVKLDGTFVQEAASSTTRDQVSSIAAQITEAIGAELIVEGIETEAMLERAVGWGGRYGQGYYLGRPELDLGAVLPQHS